MIYWLGRSRSAIKMHIAKVEEYAKSQGMGARVWAAICPRCDLTSGRWLPAFYTTHQQALEDSLCHIEGKHVAERLGL